MISTWRKISMVMADLCGSKLSARTASENLLKASAKLASVIHETRFSQTRCLDLAISTPGGSPFVGWGTCDVRGNAPNDISGKRPRKPKKYKQDVASSTGPPHFSHTTENSTVPEEPFVYFKDASQYIRIYRNRKKGQIQPASNRWAEKSDLGNKILNIQGKCFRPKLQDSLSVRQGISERESLPWSRGWNLGATFPERSQQVEAKPPATSNPSRPKEGLFNLRWIMPREISNPGQINVDKKKRKSTTIGSKNVDVLEPTVVRLEGENRGLGSVKYNVSLKGSVSHRDTVVSKNRDVDWGVRDQGSVDDLVGIRILKEKRQSRVVSFKKHRQKDRTWDMGRSDCRERRKSADFTREENASRKQASSNQFVQMAKGRKDNNFRSTPIFGDISPTRNTVTRSERKKFSISTDPLNLTIPEDSLQGLRLGERAQLTVPLLMASSDHRGQEVGILPAVASLFSSKETNDLSAPRSGTSGSGGTLSLPGLNDWLTGSSPAHDLPKIEDQQLRKKESTQSISSWKDCKTQSGDQLFLKGSTPESLAVLNELRPKARPLAPS